MPERPKKQWRGMGHRIEHGQAPGGQDDNPEERSDTPSSGSAVAYTVKEDGEVEPIAGEGEEEEEEGEEEEGEEQAESGFLEFSFIEPELNTHIIEFEPTQNVGGILICIVFAEPHLSSPGVTFLYGGETVPGVGSIVIPNQKKSSEWRFKPEPKQGKQKLEVSFSGTAQPGGVFVWGRVLYQLTPLNQTLISSFYTSNSSTNSDRAEFSYEPATGTAYIVGRRNHPDSPSEILPQKIIQASLPYAPSEKSSNIIVSRAVINKPNLLQLAALRWPTLISGSGQQGRTLQGQLITI